MLNEDWWIGVSAFHAFAKHPRVSKTPQGQTLFAVDCHFAAWYIVRMARPLRIEFSDAIYHVMAGGNGRQAIFHTDADHQRMTDGLART